MSGQIFFYGDREMGYLCNADSRLAALINKTGKIEREINPDIFDALVSSIISQQISGKAAAAVKRRVIDVVGGRITPENIKELPFDSLKNCGLSAQKVHYIKTAAQEVVDGTIDLAQVKNLPDEDIITMLTALPGVGRWTAEMLLIFSLGRSDVISYNDFGIRKGLQLLHGTEKIGKREFLKLTAPYHPYATVASFYLWYAANNNWQP